MKKLTILNVIILLAFSLLNATIIHIPSDFSTIQGGIDASVEGDTVLIAQGTYYENLNLEKEIVLASHAINDNLGSGWLNNENIQETIISGAQPTDPNKGSCLIIRDGDIHPTIIGLTFQDGDGTSMMVDNCGVILKERSGGAILMYKAYPTIMYNRFINNGHETDNLRASGGGRKGGAMSHYSDDGIEFDEDRSYSNRSDNWNSKTIGEYIFGNPDDVAAYNNGMNLQKIQESGGSSEASSFTELEELMPVARDIDFVPGDGVRSFSSQNNNQNNNSSRDIPDTLNIRNNYFENNASGDGENFYSYGYEGSIDISFSIFEDIDCATGKANEFVLRSIEEEADYIQNEISGDCIESNSFYVSAGSGDDNSEGTESDPFKTIGHALSLVKDGETITTINISGGNYSPSTNGERFPIVLPDNVHLIGASMQWTRLNAEADENDEAAVMIIKEVEDVRVANLTLIGGYSEGHGCTGGGGLLITADDMFNADGFDARWTYATIENVIIEDNHSHNGGGLSIYRSKGSVLNNVIIRNNTASAFGGGVFTYGSTLDMTNVTVTENSNNIGGTAQGGGMMMPITGGTLDNMTITDNEGCCGGAGIWTNGNNCTWTMTNSIIDGNSGDWGGGLAILGGDVNGAEPTLINVTISNNTASSNGGAVWTVGGLTTPTFRNCTFTGNTAYGVDMGGTFWLMGGTTSLTDCLISDNTVPYAAAGIWAMDVTGLYLNRVTIADNSGGWNPGVFISDAFDNGGYTPAYITNCTITGNSSPNGGAVRATYGGHLSIINSIIWDNNTPWQVSLEGGGASISYSDIDNGWSGSGNINLDPQFVDPENGDYNLMSVISPCIDAGIADLNGDGIEDIDYVGAAPDMGAFEVGGILGCTDPEAENFDPEANMDNGSCQYGPPEISVSYNTGWNMVGLPLEVEDSNYQTLFPSAPVNAMYSFDGSYSPEDYLVVGTGYLIRLLDGGAIEFTGTIISGLTISLTEGWNLISGISASLSVDELYNSGLVVTDGIYAFDGSYYNASTIDPGMGYWVRAIEDGEITLGSAPAEFMMTIVLDNYPSETTWNLSGPEGGVGGGGPYSDPGGVVEFSAVLVPGDYVWTIYDEWGDGICCGFGNGSYELMLDGEVIATGGQFGGSESVNFTVGARSHVNSLTTTHLPDDVEYPDVKGDTPFVGNIDFITETIEYNVDDEINRSGSAKQVSIMNRLESSNSITFSSGTYSTELYFGVEIPEEEILSYSLPPTFPQMAFDVRFSDETKLVPESGEIEVITQSEMITITYDIKVDAGEHMTWVLTSESNNDYILEGTGKFVISSVERFTLERKSAVVPATFTLHQNYPNPFNPITSLSYDLPEQAQVTLTIYDLIGREVTQLINTIQEAGYKSVQWNATDTFGKPVSAGVYLYQIQAGEFAQTRKMVLLK